MNLDKITKKQLFEQYKEVCAERDNIRNEAKARVESLKEEVDRDNALIKDLKEKLDSANARLNDDSREDKITMLNHELDCKRVMIEDLTQKLSEAQEGFDDTESENVILLSSIKRCRITITFLSIVIITLLAGIAFIH